MKKTFSLLAFGLACSLAAQPKLKLEDFALGFTRPVDIAHCKDSRLFIVEQAGKIWAVDSTGQKIGTAPFLDITDRVYSTGNEQGLLGLAFHPNYAQNGLFFIYYTKKGTGNEQGDTRVSRFKRDSLDANKADAASEKILLTADQPYANHNGGCLKFGPDGYLYTGLGDGGSAGDPQGNGQNQKTFLAKMLRIDIDHGDPYTVPATNPHVGDAAWLPEIWHTGLRNPWRFSFDRQTGDMWIGDVGQGAHEEIDFQAVGIGGLNFGWKCYEGNYPYATTGCQPQSFYTAAAFDYPNPSQGCSVTGGFVYRGAKYSEIFGTYIFADYCSGRFWQVRRNADGTFTGKDLGKITAYQYSSFGENRDGDLFVAQLAAGKISRVTELCSAFQIKIEGDTAVCPNTFSGILKAKNTGSSAATSFAWSNSKTDSLNVYLNPGTYTVTATDANGCTRTASATIGKLGVPSPVIFCFSQPHLCGDDTLTLHTAPAPAGIGIQWFMNGLPLDTAVHDFITVRVPGSYAVHFSGDTICPVSVSDSFLITQSIAPQAVLPGDVPPTPWYVLGGAIGSFDSIQWQRLAPNVGWTDIPNATHDTLSLSAGPYDSLRVWVADTFGCKFFSDVVLTVWTTSHPASVEKIALQPNPTSGQFSVELDLKTAQRGQFQLLDAQGRLAAKSESFFGEEIRRAFDLRGLPGGTYFLKIELESGSFVRAVFLGN